MGINIKGGIRPFTNVVRIRNNVPPQWITSDSLGDFSLNIASSYQLSATDPEAKTLYYSAQSLPEGLTLDANGTLSGTPTKIGTYSITVKVTDGFSKSYKTFTLTVKNDPPVWETTGGDIGTWNQNQTSSFSFQATDPNGHTVSYSVVSGVLPSGVTLGTDGTLSGTPNESGNFSFTVRATDTEGSYSDRSFSMTVDGGLTQGDLGNVISILNSTSTNQTFDEKHYYKSFNSGGSEYRGAVVVVKYNNVLIDFNYSVLNYDNLVNAYSILGASAARTNITLQNFYVRASGNAQFVVEQSYNYGYGNYTQNHYYKNAVFDLTSLSYNYLFYINKAYTTHTNVKFVINRNQTTKSYTNGGGVTGHQIVYSDTSEGQQLINEIDLLTS